jgi:uncharacterized membrane protein YjgN (DUF898 family)
MDGWSNPQRPPGAAPVVPPVREAPMPGPQAWPATAPSAAAATGVVPHFAGTRTDLWRLMRRGSVLLLLTLGLYRFWLITDLRRYMWSRTVIDGDSFDYTGSAREILIGFLIGLTLTLPIYVVFFLLALDSGILGENSGIIAILAVAILGQFAIYRARRYRLSRTVLRGIRWFQTGSALLYMLQATLWWTLTLMTLGLAYPFHVAALERYKARHTHFGTWTARFEGSALTLLRRGFILWLLVVAPTLVALVGFGKLDWDLVDKMFAAEGASAEARAATEAFWQANGLAIGLAVLGLIWGAIAGALLWPVFQACVWRWWLEGLRLGPVSATSQFRTGPLYRAYLRFGLVVLLIGIVSGIATLIISVVLTAMLGEKGLDTVPGQVTMTGVLVLSYAASMLALSAAWQVIIRTQLWGQAFESLTLQDWHRVAEVRAAGIEASAVGEGLADALNVGGV